METRSIGTKNTHRYGFRSKGLTFIEEFGPHPGDYKENFKRYWRDELPRLATDAATHMNQNPPAVTPLVQQAPKAYLWQYAAAVAAEAHEGQKPPGSAMPYFAHPARVAMLVSAVFGCHNEEVLAVAYLHDVLEKTSLNREALNRVMGSRIAEWVEWLSKNPTSAKGEYWKKLSQAPWQPRLVKMADALDHLNGPPEYLPDRLKSARKALKLAFSEEPEIRRAASALIAAIDALERPFEQSSTL